MTTWAVLVNAIATLTMAKDNNKLVAMVVAMVIVTIVIIVVTILWDVYGNL